MHGKNAQLNKVLRLESLWIHLSRKCIIELNNEIDFKFAKFLRYMQNTIHIL